MLQDCHNEATSAEFRSTDAVNEGRLDQTKGRQTGVLPAKASSELLDKQPNANHQAKMTDDTLDATEFRQSIANWFGPKGFNAMRSFFRSSVLNTLQFEKIGQKHKKHSDFEIAIFLLIADHLMSTGCHFTMSVFIAEVLKPLTHQHQIVKIFNQRIGRTAIFERLLSKEDVAFVLTGLNIDSFSELGVSILNSYCRGDGLNLLSVLLKLHHLPVQDFSLNRGNSFNDDVAAAFSEGVHNEVEKFRCWFAEFSSQFTDTTMMLREMCRLLRARSRFKLAETGNHDGKVSKLCDKVSSIVDEQLREKDEERRKLAVYAKQLDSLRREMNVKLDAVRNYENILKAKENALNELLGENLIFRDEKETNFHRERGDFVKYSNLIGAPSARCDRRCCPDGDFSPGFDEQQNGTFSATGKLNVGLLEENDRLKFELRQQRLKIDVLTKRCTALDSALKSTVVPDHQLTTFQQVAHQPSALGRLDHKRYPSDQHVEPLTRVVSAARNELNRLKEDRRSADLHYQLLLNWK